MSPRAFENNGLCKIWGANKVIMGNSKIENSGKLERSNFACGNRYFYPCVLMVSTLHFLNNNN